METNGIITREIGLHPRDAIERLENALKQNGVTIYARIDQQEESGKAGLEVFPLIFLLFGNPAKGGLVMKSNPLAALDLPLKVIAWQNDKKQNFLSYNNVEYIVDRYSLIESVGQAIDIGPLLAKLFS
jgi:uncharacterized protein (DUF302 family)